MLKHCVSTNKRGGISTAVRLLTTRNSKALLQSNKLRVANGIRIGHAMVRPFASRRDDEKMPSVLDDTEMKLSPEEEEALE